MNEYKITLISADGAGVQREFEISPEGCARLVEGGLRGFDCTGFEVTLSPYSSTAGGYPSSRRFGERVLGLTFELVGGGERSDSSRRALVSMLNPKNDFVLDVTLYGVRRKIGVIPYDEPEFSRAVLSDSIEVSISFIAPAVFFEDSETAVRQFRDRAPMLTFPMNLYAGAGTVAGMSRTENTAEVNNPGDGECGVVVTMRALGGSVTNPGIKHGSEYIRCPIVLSAGQELVIDTRVRHKSILLDGEKYFSFERGSTFFSLPPGRSSVSITCTSGGEFIDAAVEYTPLYFGM